MSLDKLKTLDTTQGQPVFLTMKDGGVVRARAIVAVRPREALPQYGLGPAVIVEYEYENRHNASVNECQNEAEQEVLLRTYKTALGII